MMFAGRKPRHGIFFFFLVSSVRTDRSNIFFLFFFHLRLTHMVDTVIQNDLHKCSKSLSVNTLGYWFTGSEAETSVSLEVC